MLRARGAKVGHQQLCNLLEFVEKVCPWFPEEGTVNLETWKKVREKLQDCYDVHGPGKVPVDTFSVWTLIRDSLDPRRERDKAWGSQKGEEKWGNIGDVSLFEEENETRSTAPPEETSCGKPFDLMPTKDREEEPLNPGDAEQLEEEATGSAGLALII
uniref:Beta-retroviral matrix protein domain-containing protein n=1 Tax=Rousettus aegyptiacus TaxID=9407 RepID=A0A7J8DXS1_ROUAE|nr:hypothetical protein HJG63_008307 [Rousettus aegyptiacus]